MGNCEGGTTQPSPSGTTQEEPAKSRGRARASTDLRAIQSWCHERVDRFHRRRVFAFPLGARLTSGAAARLLSPLESGQQALVDTEGTSDLGLRCPEGDAGDPHVDGRPYGLLDVDGAGLLRRHGSSLGVPTNEWQLVARAWGLNACQTPGSRSRHPRRRLRVGLPCRRSRCVRRR